MLTKRQFKSAFLLIAVLSLGLSTSFASAWVSAPANPPNNNVSGPLHVGAASQVKLGGFWAGTIGSQTQFCITVSSCISQWPQSQWTVLSASSIYYSAGKVGIGTVSPVGALDVVGFVYMAPQTSAPYTCDAAHKGTLAVSNATSRLCECNGTAWVHDYNGSACVWAADITAPSTPTGLAAAVVSSSQINLSWSASTDNVGVTGYQVYCNGTQIGTTAGTTYNATGLSGSTSYTCYVRAYDAAGNVSSNSTSVTQTTSAPPDTTAPSTPTGLTATAVSTSQINLSWSASTDNVGVTGYQVYCNGTQIGTTAGTTYSATGLTSNTSYTCYVRAYDAAGNYSSNSSTVTQSTLALPDTTAPSTPTGLTATAVSSSQINLSWNASTDNVGVTGYQIYRGGIQIGTTAGTTYSNVGLSAITMYTYTVRAYDAAGNVSAHSASASATTQFPK